MKDWKAAHDELKGRVAELQRQLDYANSRMREKEEQAQQVKNDFKKLLLDVLGD